MAAETTFKKGTFKYRRTNDDLSVLGDLKKGGANDQGSKLRISTQVVQMTGGAATVTVSNARLAKKIILGVTARVVTAVAGAGLTTIQLGDGTDADRYGTGIAIAKGTTVTLADATADPQEFLTAAGNIVFTAAAGQFDSGEVRLDVHYIDLDAPTS